MVSIILPNLNTPLEFLEQRINSILNQAFIDWECIVVDGFSTNGSWELIREKTAGDARFMYCQKPPKGIYDAWNEGIKLTKGEYIYIATSDDLFDKDFLAKMVKALDANADCGVAHCCLNIIDDDGKPTASQWRDWEKVQFYGDHIHHYHKRIAPYDAIVHFGWNTVYSSIVQLLVRKDVFEQVGYFSTEYGTVADFEWGLRTAFCTNIIHIPLYLASWRRHSGQASQEDFINSSEFYSMLMKMCKNVLKNAGQVSGSKIHNAQGLYFNYLLEKFNHTAKDQKIKFFAHNFVKTPYSTFKVLLYRLFYIKLDTAAFLRKQLAKRNLDKLLYDIK